MWVHFLIFVDFLSFFFLLFPHVTYIQMCLLFCGISTVDFLKRTNRLDFVCVCLCVYGCVSCSAVTPEHQRGAPKEEFFITDVAYCEQAVIFLKQAKLPQNNSQRRKEDGTLPVSARTRSPLLQVPLPSGKLFKSFKMLFQTGELCKYSSDVKKWEENLQMGLKWKY